MTPPTGGACPSRQARWSSGFIRESAAPAALPPTLAKNARMGHPRWEWCTERSIKGGPPALKGGVGGFAADAFGGNAFSGVTDLITSIATGEGGGHNVFYNMGQGVAAGPTLGFGAAFGKAIEGTPWASGPVDAVTAGVLGEYASGFGEVKLAYDAATYFGAAAGCAFGIIH